MQSTKYGASEGAKSKWADVEVAEYQPGGGHVGDNLQQYKGTAPLIFCSNALSLSRNGARCTSLKHQTLFLAGQSHHHEHCWTKIEGLSQKKIIKLDSI